MEAELINNVEGLEGELGYKGERGYSAYEIAVQNGFEGTEQDWIDHFGLDLTDYIKDTDIVDNCESTTTTKPLSANQGKRLMDWATMLYRDKANKDTDLEDEYSTSEVLTHKTWMGKPVYRIVIDTGDLATGFSADDNIKLIPHGISNVDEIINTECRAYYLSGNSFDYDNYVYYSTVLSNWIKLNVNVGRVGIELAYLNSERLSSIASSYIAIEYTKITNQEEE